jgi:hypothetical protein
VDNAKRVTELRKAGKLNEAEASAKLILERDPEDWSARAALCWVFWAQIKALCDEIRKTDADSGKSKTVRIQPNILRRIQERLDEYAALEPKTPDLCHSQILFALRDIGRHLSQFERFLRRFPEECFRDEDFKPVKSHDGKEFTALAVSVSREAIKWCFTQARIQRSNAEWVYEWASPIFDKTQDPFLAMDLALLCARLKRHDEAIKYALILLASKRNESWAWKVLADVALANDEPATAAAALCRACELGRSDDFTGAYRILLATILVQEREYAWASKEAEHVRTFYNTKGWSLKAELVGILEASWFASALAEDFDARAARKLRSERAIEALCDNVETVDACYVNLDYKRRPMYIANLDGDARLMIDYARRAPLALTPGQSVRIRMGRLDSRIELLSLTANTDVPAWSAVPSCTTRDSGKRIDGSARRFKALIRKMPAGFGFLEGDTRVFVGPDLASKTENNQTVEAIAVWQLNKKRNEMGWSAIALF